MKTSIPLAVALGLGLAQAAHAADSGGWITSAKKTSDQVALQFSSANGYSYQVQANGTVGSSYWSDSLPATNATGGLTSVSVPAPGTFGLFRVLEFTNRTFWYDWSYYYEEPTLAAWGLGSPLHTYAHSDRAYEWFIDQADTGPDAGNNCGPSSVTMAIKWYDPSFSQTAEDARNTYPEGHGWWYTSDIINYLNLYSIPNTTSYFTGTGSRVIAGYAALLAIGFHLRVIYHEEPWLLRQFGDEWVGYSASVRRWLPRLSPWKQHERG